MPPQLRLLENKETGEQGLWNPETESFFDPQDYRVIQHKRSGQQALFDSTNQSIVAFLPSRVREKSIPSPYKPPIAEGGRFPSPAGQSPEAATIEGIRESYKRNREVFRNLMKTDPSFAQLPLEERSKFLMGAEEKPSIMEPIMGTAKAIPEAIVGIGKAAHETGKTLISPPPLDVRPTETIEEAKARRRGLIVRAGLRGATLGLVGEEKEPLSPEEERLAHAAEFITAAAPFGAAIKTGERLAHLARAPRLLGAAVGGGAAAFVGAPPGQRVEQFGVGAGVVGSLGGAFGLAGHLFRRLKGREPTSRAEVVEAIREEPAFEEALKEERAKAATEQSTEFRATREEPAFVEALKEERAKGATEQVIPVSPKEVPAAEKLVPEALAAPGEAIRAEEGVRAEPEGIPAFISKTRKQELADLGYRADEIARMSPSDAETIVRGQRIAAVPRIEPTEAGIQGVLAETPQRITPTTTLRAKAEQTEAPTPLEEATAPKQQMELGEQRVSLAEAKRIAKQFPLIRDVTETPRGFEPKFDAGVAINRTREVIEQREAFKRALTEGPPELPPKGGAKTPKSYVTKTIEETMPDLPFGETAKIETDKSRAAFVLQQVGYPVEEMLEIIGGEKPWPTKTEFLKSWDNYQWWVGIELAQKNAGYFRKFGLKTAALSERFSSGVEYADAMREIDAKQRSSGLRLASEIIPEKPVPSKAPLTPEEQAAPDLSQLSLTELVKKGFGEETGQVGRMTPEQQATARAARQARREIYGRVREAARQTGKTIFEAAQELGISRKTAIKIARQYRQQKENPEVAYAKQLGDLVTDVGQVNPGDIVYDRLLDTYAWVVGLKGKNVVQLASGMDRWTAAVGNRLELARQISNAELIKKSLTETGAVGKLTPEQQALEVEARAARKELYRRLSEEARKTGENLDTVAERMKVPLQLVQRARGEQEAASTTPIGSESISLDQLSESYQATVKTGRKAEKQKGEIRIGRAAQHAVEPSTGLENLDAALKTTAKRNQMEVLRDFKERLLSSFQFEREVSSHPLLVDDLRLFQRERELAFRQAANDLSGILGGLKGRQEYDLASQIIALRDMVSRIKSGQKVQAGIELSEAEQGLATLQSQANPRVLEAVDRHFNIINAIGQEKVARGWMTEEALREDYFKHVVLMYGEKRFGTPKRLRHPLGEKAAKGSILPIEHDYFKVMYDYLARHRYNKALEDFVNTEAAKLDRTALGKGAFGEEFAIRPGQIIEIGKRKYKGFQFDPGNQVYPAATVKDGVVNKAIKQGLEEIGISIEEFEALRAGEAITEHLRKGLVIGRKKPTYLLDLDIANRLEKFAGPEIDSPLLRLANRATAKWKGLTINFAGMTFQTMNLAGDLLNIMRADLLAPLYVPKAIATLRGKTVEARSLVRLADELEVTNAGFVVKEAESLFRHPEFQNLRTNLQKLGLPISIISDRLLAFQNFRENIPRMALLLRNLGRLEGGEAGIAKLLAQVPEGQRVLPIAETMRAIRPLKTAEIGVEELPPVRAAGKVAREVPVDYGKFTPEESKLVRGLLFPFYAWTKQNTIGWLSFIASHPGKFTATALAPWVITEIYNQTNYPDIEKQLPDYIQDVPHLITGFNDKNGKPTVLYFPGYPPSEALGVIGLEKVPKQVVRLALDEKFTLDEAAWDTMKNMLKAPVRTFGQLLTPLIKVPVELFSGRSIFTGGPLMSKRLEGTPEETFRLARHTYESFFRPAREARRITEDIQRGKYDPFSARYGLGLPYKEFDIDRSVMNVFFDKFKEVQGVRNQLRQLQRQEKHVEADEFEIRNQKQIYLAKDMNRALRKMRQPRIKIDRIEANEKLSALQKEAEQATYRREIADIARNVLGFKVQSGPLFKAPKSLEDYREQMAQ